MRWPSGPPHLTLKPSKKNKNKKKKTKKPKTKTKKQKTKSKKNKEQKKQAKNKKIERKSKKHKNTKKELFSYQSKFSFLGGCPKIAFFDNLAQKTRTGVSKSCLFWQLGPENAHPQNTLKIGVSAYVFWKKLCVTKRPFLDQKTQIQKFPLSFFGAFFLSFNNKKHQIFLKPLFL